jgi:hypothetical protein
VEREHVHPFDVAERRDEPGEACDVAQVVGPAGNEDEAYPASSVQRQTCRVGLHLRAGRRQGSSRRRGYAWPGSSRRRIGWPVTSAIRS